MGCAITGFNNTLLFGVLESLKMRQTMMLWINPIRLVLRNRLNNARFVVGNVRLTKRNGFGFRGAFWSNPVSTGSDSIASELAEVTRQIELRFTMFFPSFSKAPKGSGVLKRCACLVPKAA